jgi:hypothetical protein
VFPGSPPDGETGLNELPEGSRLAPPFVMGSLMRAARGEMRPAIYSPRRLKLRTCVEALEQEAEALTYLDFRLDSEKWRNGHPKLAAWHARFNTRPSVAANPPVDDR